MKVEPIKINLEMLSILPEYDEINNIINEQLKKVEAEKMRLINERINEFTGHNIDILTEVHKMFPRIRIRQSAPNNSQQVFWNDGSDTGKLLIEFFYSNITESNEGAYRFSVGFKYR